ncbi:MAG: acyltransferase [Rhodothermia bacterium]|nr:acyltransferase [Rhodothermia bacterium]
MTDMLAVFSRYLLRRDLKSAFRRVSWVGDRPSIDSSRPLVVYVNHNNFFDGHLLWLASREILNRQITIWMREWDRFPIFAPEGAMPFPADDPSRRASTIRETAYRLNHNRTPQVLVYFPGGELTRPELPIADFDKRTFERLSGIMPLAMWMPIGIHVTWWGENRPTALLGSGPASASIDGSEQSKLERVLTDLKSADPSATEPIMTGRTSPNEQWNLSILSKLYRK